VLVSPPATDLQVSKAPVGCPDRGFLFQQRNTAEREQQLIARDETSISRLLIKWGKVHSLHGNTLDGTLPVAPIFPPRHVGAFLFQNLLNLDLLSTGNGFE
jgi:hypothetical protein